MNTFPENEIKDVNNLLWKTLGPEGEDLLGKGEEETFRLLKQLENDIYLKVYKLLNFYYPLRIAINTIEKSDAKYREFAASNILLVALTSIIDWLAKSIKTKEGWTDRFVSFLETNLRREKINNLINKASIINERGKIQKLSSLKALGRYLYKIRSLVVHNAELGGLYPYNLYFRIEKDKFSKEEVTFMIEPKEFRKLLFKAIFQSLGMDVIAN